MTDWFILSLLPAWYICYAFLTVRESLLNVISLVLLQVFWAFALIDERERTREKQSISVTMQRSAISSRLHQLRAEITPQMGLAERQSSGLTVGQLSILDYEVRSPPRQKINPSCSETAVRQTGMCQWLPFVLLLKLPGCVSSVLLSSSPLCPADISKVSGEQDTFLLCLISPSYPHWVTHNQSHLKTMYLFWLY